MWYVCDVSYAVLYVRVNYFVARGCAAWRRHINVCNSDVLMLFICAMTISSYMVCVLML